MFFISYKIKERRFALLPDNVTGGLSAGRDSGSSPNAQIILRSLVH
jgi:hypothetical protein